MIALFVALCLIPLIYLPLVNNPIITVQWSLMVLISYLLSAGWAIGFIHRKQGEINISPLFWALILATLSTSISTIITSANMVETMLSVLGPITFLSLTMILTLIPRSDALRNLLRWTLFVSIGLLAIIPQIPFLKTLTGPPLTSLTLLLLTLPLLIQELRRNKIISLILLSVALGLVSYSRQLPVLWQTLPSGQNFSFNKLISVVGMMGIITILYFLWVIIRLAIKALSTSPRSWGLAVSLGLSIPSLVLTPPNPTLFLFFILMASIFSPADYSKTVKISLPGLWRAAIFGGLIIILSSIAIYFLARNFVSEVVYFQSGVSLSQGRGTSSYNQQIQAIRLNPYLTKYHLSFSRTNLLLTQTIVDQVVKIPNSFDEDTRQTIIKLIQQAIREGKIATQLAPRSPQAWENLAGVYQSLIPIAAGADNWSIAAYQQAIHLDPVNPRLRIALGGAYVSAKNYDLARQTFQTAISLKPDLANAYYNLANVYRLQNQPQAARLTLEQTLKLVSGSPADTQIVQNEIKGLEQKIQKIEIPQTPSQLTKPASPIPLFSPLLSLPKD